MSEERLPCLTPGCSNSIQPATARRNGGYCGPCAGRRKTAAREEYIQKNRKDVDLYAGITDPVEMLKIMHQPQSHDPLVNLLSPPSTFEQLYTQLTPDQARRMMQIAADALRRGETDLAERIASLLAAFTDYSLDVMLDTWVERRHFWPSLAFRHAGVDISKGVMNALDDPTTNADHALRALAWIKSAEVLRFLIESEHVRSDWRSQLRVSPAEYATQAGWEIAGGQRRDLTFDGCLSISPAEEQPKDESPLSVMQEVEEQCRWCGRAMVNLVRIDLAAPGFSFLQVGGPRVDVLTCDMCTCYGECIFAELDEGGHGHWAPENRRPRFLPSDGASWERSPWAAVQVHLSPRRVFHAADWFLPTSFTQIGGLPTWVQQPDYPKCPKCSQTMLFLAQIDNGQFPLNEGIYYAFLCPTCRVTATTYQQS